MTNHDQTDTTTEATEDGPTQRFRVPDRIAIDALGYGWRAWDDDPLFVSMVPQNPDNSPIPQPLTWFVRVPEREHELTEGCWCEPEVEHVEARPPITDEWEFVLTFDEAKAIARSILVGDEEATQVKAEINRLVIDCLTEAVETLEDAA